MIAMRELNTNFVNNTPNMANSGPNHEITGPMVASAPLSAQSAALTKRCVIIQKDERGYGLRVSGDNPVFVESVRRDGAAWRAGVRAGDRIIKVNGTLVTKHGHGEVVRMIQNCGSYVGLTLLGLKTTPTTSTVAPSQIQITGPQPVSESTQQAYEESRMATIREMIRREREYLDKMTTKKNQSEIDKTIKSIQALELTLEKMTLDVTKQRHTSMSAENLTTATSSDASVAAANARKSHSFGQYDTRAPIMTMESDEENDDFTNNNNNSRNSNINSNNKTSHPDISDIPSTVDAIHAHSLKMARWLISQQCPPHALLFYTMAGHVFPSLVNASNSRRNLQKWAWQIACTWLVPDSPLAFFEFPPEILSTFDNTLASPQSSLETLFEPFIEQTRDILNQQLDAWRSAAIIGLAPQTFATPKEELHATIELLLNEPTTNIELVIDNLISHAHVNNVSTIAVVTSLLTIGHYVFSCPSKHLILSHTDSSTSPPPNPVLKLSDHSSSSSNKKHKRAVSLPSRTINPGHIEAGHHFVQTHELTKLLFCSGCLLPIWGTFGHTCAHCQMSVHVWCMKNAAANSPCPGPQSDGNPPQESTPSARMKKNRRWNSDRYTLIDIIKKTVAHAPEPHAPPLISSTSSSSDDEDDNVTTGVTATSSPTVIADTSANSTTPTPPNTIPRSESFKQPRKTVPSYRKRSDPALTASNTTLATTVTTDSNLTPDISGSPTNTSPDNWISSSDDEDDQSQSDAQQQQNNTTSPNTPAVIAQTTIDEDTPPPLPPRPPSEKRKQIHNEIIESEERHVEVLRFIHNVFYRPLNKEQLLTSEQLLLVFCNTKRLMKIHRRIYRMLKSPNKSIEQSLCDIFCGELGSQLETEASIFCTNQKLGGLDTWRARKKDSRLRYFLDPEVRTKEMPDCPLARLSLEDHLGTVFQRPLRYQLLLDRLLHATPSDSVEYQLIARALARSREIGSIVNEATRKAELKQRLQEIVRKTDRTQGLTLDLEGHNLLHEGALTWRITKQKCVDVWLLLTDRLLVILARDSDRFVLKPHTNPSAKTQHANPSAKTQHMPTVFLNDLLTRDVATDPTAFFLISTDQDIFYEFAAATPNERKTWKEAIANATMTSNAGKSPQQHVTKLRDLTSQPSTEEEVKPKDGDEADSDNKAEKQDVEELENINDNDNDNNNNNSNDNIAVDNVPNDVSRDSQAQQSPQVHPDTQSSRVEGVIRYVRDDECHAPDLISPSRVLVSSEPVVDEALAVQAPQQQIAEIDLQINKLLEEKRSILARMHGINDQWEWSVVCDFAQHDDMSSAGREMTFFDKAMSLVSTLARDGLTRESYIPLVSLRDQIDALLARLSLEIESQSVDASSAEQEHSIYFPASDQTTEETAVYF